MTEASAIEDKLKIIFSCILNMPLEGVGDELHYGKNNNWTGNNHHALIKKIEREFDIEFDTSELETLHNYNIIKNTLLSHLNID